jgi:hypothetical protein
MDFEGFHYDEFDSKILQHKIDILPNLPIEYQVNKDDKFETYMNLYNYYRKDKMYHDLPYEFYSDFILSETERCLEIKIEDQKFYSEFKKIIFV